MDLLFSDAFSDPQVTNRWKRNEHNIQFSLRLFELLQSEKTTWPNMWDLDGLGMTGSMWKQHLNIIENNLEDDFQKNTLGSASGDPNLCLQCGTPKSGHLQGSLGLLPPLFPTVSRLSHRSFFIVFISTNSDFSRNHNQANTHWESWLLGSFVGQCLMFGSDQLHGIPYTCNIR